MFRCPLLTQALDGGDNGVSQYPADIAPKYKVGTALPQRVAQLNPGAAVVSKHLCVSLRISISPSVCLSLRPLHVPLYPFFDSLSLCKFLTNILIMLPLVTFTNTPMRAYTEWNEEGIDVNARFARAVEISGADLVACVHSVARVWWPARSLVVQVC